MVSISSTDGGYVCNRELLTTFLVSETATRIREARFTRVALQFPDCLLKSAPLIYSALRELLDPTILIFILGDTSYGACCADEVAAQHLNAQAIVHYGQSCLSPTRTLPVLHIFPNRCEAFNENDKTEIFDAIRTVFRKEPSISRILVMYDIPLTLPIESLKIHNSFNCDEKIVEVAQPAYSSLRNFVQASSNEDRELSQSDQLCEKKSCFLEKCGALCFRTIRPIHTTAILWISEEQDLTSDSSSPAMQNAAMQLANGISNPYDKMFHLVIRKSFGEVDASRLLRRRASGLIRIAHAERIGVVAGTLATSGANKAIERTVSIIEQAGKRAYVILVGKVTPPKLLNFEEVDAFVFVSCPIRALFTSKEVPVPILTPFELEVALRNNTSLYEIPYKVGFERSTGTTANKNEATSTNRSVSVRSGLEMSVLDGSSAVTFHKSRIWKGLSQNTGGENDDIPIEALSTEIRDGSSGTALFYSREK